MQASIFVVDDQVAFRNALEKLLSRMQHRIRSFQSGEELSRQWKKMCRT